MKIEGSIDRTLEIGCGDDNSTRFEKIMNLI